MLGLSDMRAEDEGEVEMWQPIETAPRNKGAILITDGKLFAAAAPYDYYEPPEIGYNNPVGFGGNTRRPNPEYGKIRRLWSCFGCSSFAKDAVTYDSEYNCPINIEPTHWMQLFDAPK